MKIILAKERVEALGRIGKTRGMPGGVKPLAIALGYPSHSGLADRLKKQVLWSHEAPAICEIYKIAERIFTSDRYVKLTGGKPYLVGFEDAVLAHWSPIEVRPIESGELEYVFGFDEPAYGDGNNIQIELFRQWHEAFTIGFLCAFVNDTIPVAGMGCFPVDAEFAEAFLNYDVDETGLDGSTIRRGKADRKVWYLSGLNVDQTKLPGMASRATIGKLILEWACRNANVIGRDEIHIVSQGTTPLGRRLLRMDFRFDPVPVPPGKLQRFEKTADLRTIKTWLMHREYFDACHELKDVVGASTELLDL